MIKFISVGLCIYSDKQLVSFKSLWLNTCINNSSFHDLAKTCCLCLCHYTKHYYAKHQNVQAVDVFLYFMQRYQMLCFLKGIQSLKHKIRTSLVVYSIWAFEQVSKNLELSPCLQSYLPVYKVILRHRSSPQGRRLCLQLDRAGGRQPPGRRCPEGPRWRSGRGWPRCPDHPRASIWSESSSDRHTEGWRPTKCLKFEAVEHVLCMCWTNTHRIRKHQNS